MTDFIIPHHTPAAGITDWIITPTLFSTSVAPPHGDEEWQSRYDTAARFLGREFEYEDVFAKVFCCLN